MKKHQFKLEEVEPFRYRAQDAWRAITKNAVREARIKEIKQEIYNSEKMKTFFEENPHDLQVLRHDKPTCIVRAPEHLSEVPDYIVPAPLKNIIGVVTKTKRNHHNISNAKRKFQKKSSNPLAVAEIDFAAKNEGNFKFSSVLFYQHFLHVHNCYARIRNEIQSKLQPIKCFELID